MTDAPAAPDPAALTLAQAAAELGVEPQRVNQLLRDGKLEGPDYGERRAPKNAPRVYVDSLNAYKPNKPGRPSTSSRNAKLNQELDSLRETVAQARGNERSARQAAMELKIGLDKTFDDLKAALDRNQRQAEELAVLRARLEAADRRIQALETVRSAYDHSLTSLLGPDNPDALRR